MNGTALVAGNMSACAWIFRKPLSAAGHLLQLDIRITSPLLGERTLVESFAGLGSDEPSAINSAWEKFSRCLLHLMIEVFLHRKGNDDQVEWERWANNGNLWQVCLGPLFAMSFEEQLLPNLACGDLLDHLRDTLLRKISRECHWLRFYYMKQGNRCLGSECLLDNDSWPEGQTLVDNWNWPEGFYSVRLFLVMLPEEQVPVL